MSSISIALNLLLATLLLATLLFGYVLNRRLKALKDSHAGFAAAVEHLDRAAERAEAGLADLRSATDQAVDLLTSRIMKAREMADSLDRLTVQAAGVLERRGAAPPPSPRAIAERIAAERGQTRQTAPLHLREPPSGRRPTFGPADEYQLTTEDEALAAAEALILKLSKSEALTTSAPPRPAPSAPLRPELRLAPRPAPTRAPAPQPAPAPAPRAEAPRPRVDPRSRAHVDDDLFEAPARGGRLRAFDGGLA